MFVNFMTIDMGKVRDGTFKSEFLYSNKGLEDLAAQCKRSKLKVTQKLIVAMCEDQ